MADQGIEATAERMQELVAALAELEARARELATALDPAGTPSELVQRARLLAGGLGQWVQQVTTDFRDLADHLDAGYRGRALGLSIIRAQEEERRRVAREIHDGPAQLLANVVLRIDVCQRLVDQDAQRVKEELQQLKELVRLSLQDVRKVIFDLRPMALDDLGLIPALRAYVKEFQSRTAIEADFATFGGERRFDPAFEVAVFRLVQESLTNVEKHARASRVWITVEAKHEELRATVKDNGIGFDLESVRHAAVGKFGLTGMRERAELIGGRMALESRPGAGTRVQFLFPLTG